MVVEGKGKVAPSPQRVILGEHEMRCIIDGSRNINRYKPRTDTWGKGLLADSVLPRLVSLTPAERPIVAGKCGEYAAWRKAVDKFGSIFLPVDFTKRAKGDGGADLQLGSTKAQIKTRLSTRTNLVKQMEYGKAIPLCGNVHVFCQWNGDLWVSLLGWLPTSKISAMPIQQSHRGDWFNYVIDDRSLLPLDRLWAEIEWRLKV